MKLHYNNQKQLNELTNKLKKYNLRNGCAKLVLTKDADKNSIYNIYGTGAQIMDFFNLFAVIDDKISRTSNWFKIYKLLLLLFNFISQCKYFL